jgi:amino acid transporter
MAREGAVPRRLGSVSRGAQVPTAAIAAVSVGALGFALVGDLTLIASVTDLAVYAVFVAVNASVLVLRRRSPDHPRPFRTPGTVHGVPLLPVAGIVAVAAMVPQLDGSALLLGLGLLAGGLLAHRWFGVAGRDAGAASAGSPPRWEDAPYG